MKLYNYAVDYEPYSLLYCDLTATPKERMYMRKLDAYLVLQTDGEQ